MIHHQIVPFSRQTQSTEKTLAFYQVKQQFLDNTSGNTAFPFPPVSPRRQTRYNNVICLKYFLFKKTENMETTINEQFSGLRKKFLEMIEQYNVARREIEFLKRRITDDSEKVSQFSELQRTLNECREKLQNIQLENKNKQVYN